MLSEPRGSLLTTLFPLLLPSGARKLGRARITFTLHTLYYAHTAPCTHPPMHTACACGYSRVQTCYTSLGFGPYRGVFCHRVEEAAALFDVCPAGLTLMITDVKSAHLSSGSWTGGKSVILGSPGP